jgi:hypothetical protein
MVAALQLHQDIDVTVLNSAGDPASRVLPDAANQTKPLISVRFFFSHRKYIFYYQICPCIYNTMYSCMVLMPIIKILLMSNQKINKQPTFVRFNWASSNLISIK